MARKPATTWSLQNEAWRHYEAHICLKQCRYSLNIVDLLYISNFKGGNGSITEPLETLVSKLHAYETALKAISRRFRAKDLSTLTAVDLQHLKKRCKAFLGLAEAPQTRIRGFGPSYASALLAAHFPDLVPILDRRVLSGAGIDAETNTQGQVKNIAKYYPRLIAEVRRLSIRRSLDVREVDRLLFIRPIAQSGRRVRLRLVRKPARS